MTKASDNAYPSLLITEGTVPSSPAAGKQRLWLDSTTHRPKLVNSSGTVTFMGSGIGCKAYRDGAQTITTSTVTAFVFAAESWDTDTIHDNSSGTSKFTVPAGFPTKPWRFTGHFGIYNNANSNNATGIRAIWLRKNGTTSIIGSDARLDASTAADACTITVEEALAAGDYVEWMIFHSKGSDLDFGTTIADDPSHVNSASAEFLG